jgi:hypothetical protein
MLGRRITYRHLALVYLGLSVATSCTPQPGVRTVSATVPVHPAAPVLLKQLDLNVPATLAASTLRPSLDASPAVADATAAPSFVAQPRSADDAARALDCLTAAIYYEARSQTLDGQRAVAQVVLNRVRDPAFPASVCGVVYQGSNRTTGCQFSFTCDGSLDRPREPLAWARASVIAADALGGAVYAPVGSATFYHANYVSPWWASSMTQVATIGAHIFYRWRGAMENALAFRQTYSGAEPLPGGSRMAAAGAVEIHEAAALAGAVETVGGVTIHRHGDSAAAAVAAAPLTAALAATTPVAAPAAARSVMMGGVRVHHDRGADTGMASDDRPASVTGVHIHRDSQPT